MKLTDSESIGLLFVILGAGFLLMEYARVKEELKEKPE